MMDLFDEEPGLAEFKAYMADPAARQAFVELKARAASEGVHHRYDHILKAVSETPWAIRPQMLAVIIDVLNFRLAGGRFTASELESRIGARRAVTPSEGVVAVIPVHGVIMARASAMGEMSGGTSIEELRGAFHEAVATPAVQSVIFDIDSPGGMVEGVTEFASEIRAARGTKPIVAVANHEAASAAYWIGSQADELVVTKSGRVGSIGVYTVHKNEGEKNAQSGVATTLVSAGKYKTERNPYEPLTDEARDYMQSMVDEFYGMFLSDVARGRGVPLSHVREGFGQGREVLARTALEDGMVDRIGSLESVITEQMKRAAVSASKPTVSITGSHLAPSIIVSAGHNVSPFMNGEIVPEPPDETPVPAPVEPEPAEPEPEEEPVPEPAMADTDELEFLAEVDNSAWDAGRAMGACKTAGDYRSICAGEHTTGDPDQRQHWALPHHYLGRGPNANGVRNALSRLPQTQDLKNKGAAQSHLDAHMRVINPERATAAPNAATDPSADERASRRRKLEQIEQYIQAKEVKM
jgi:signal peptide peptidase SppA